MNADSSAPTWAHTREIRRRGIFAEVQCAFWKEEPSLRDALFFFDDEAVHQVCVVPNFISEGYFTQTVIPRELELEGSITLRPSRQVWRYCEPVGSHPAVTDLLLARAREIAPGIEPKATAVIIVAHGTELNENSAVAAKREAERLRARGEFGAVVNAYMDESPRISDWDKLSSAPNVIVVPFFIADGLHSYEDIPAMLGIQPGENLIRAHDTFAPTMPHHLRGRSLYYARSIGTEKKFADLLVEQALNVASV